MFRRMESMLKAVFVVGNTYHFIFLLSILVIVGLFAGRFFERKRIPNLIAYILLGLGFGGITAFVGNDEIIEAFDVITAIGMGFIAFSIGLELNFKRIANRKREVILLTLIQAVLSFLFTFIALYIFVLPLHIALLFGALAIVTEPGPILVITKKLRSEGQITDTLAPLHGLEDAITIIIFGIALAYSLSVQNQTPFAFVDILKGPLLEIILSLLIGGLFGFILVVIIRFLKYEDQEKDIVILVSSLVTVLAAVAIANSGIQIGDFTIHLSPILLPMASGIVFANLSTALARHETEQIMDLFSAPVLIIFFTVMGAEIVLLIANSFESIHFGTIMLIALIYIVTRILGKLSGSWLGSKLAKSSPDVRKYLGFCLLPQAQAAIGLAFFARNALGREPYGTIILVVIVIATIVNGILGPLGIRYALTKGGEAKVLEHNTYGSGSDEPSQVIASLTKSKDNTLKDQS